MFFNILNKPSETDCGIDKKRNNIVILKKTLALTSKVHCHIKSVLRICRAQKK